MVKKRETPHKWICVYCGELDLKVLRQIKRKHPLILLSFCNYSKIKKIVADIRIAQKQKNKRGE